MVRTESYVSKSVSICPQAKRMAPNMTVFLDDVKLFTRQMDEYEESFNDARYAPRLSLPYSMEFTCFKLYSMEFNLRHKFKLFKIYEEIFIWTLYVSVMCINLTFLAAFLWGNFMMIHVVIVIALIAQIALVCMCTMQMSVLVTKSHKNHIS
jgi:hypothetical protein